MQSIHRIFYFSLFIFVFAACNNPPKAEEVTENEVITEPENVPAVPFFSSYNDAIEAMRKHKDETMVERGIIEKDKIK